MSWGGGGGVIRVVGDNLLRPKINPDKYPGEIPYRFPQIQFDYQDPTVNFDRSRVKGPVVRLLRVKEREAATALEVTAGGRVSGYVSGLLVTLHSLSHFTLHTTRAAVQRGGGHGADWEAAASEGRSPQTLYNHPAQ